MLDMFRPSVLDGKHKTFTFVANGERWILELSDLPIARNSTHEIHGITIPDEHRIVVFANSDVGSTLVHELLHAVWPHQYHEGRKKKTLPGEEEFVVFIAEGLYEALSTLRPI